MVQPKKSYTVICEGISEYAYIQQLNRWLNDNDYSCVLLPKPAGSGHFTAVQRKYQSEKRANPKQDIIIWVDKDTYVRNDAKDRENYEHKSKKMPDFQFSVMNFEDFLVLHLDSYVLENWFQICSRHRHHIKPMTENIYLPLLCQHIFNNYVKGELPFDIDTNSLTKLLRNNKGKHFFRSNFVDLLEELMSKHKPDEVKQ